MKFLFCSLLLLTLFFISWVDLKTKHIPPLGIITLLGLGIFWIVETKQPFLPQISTAFITSFLFWGLGFFLSKWKKKPALGFGDIQLWSVLTLTLGPQPLPLFVMMSGGIGLIFALFYQKDSSIPFAPALCLSFLVVFFSSNTPFSIFG